MKKKLLSAFSAAAIALLPALNVAADDIKVLLNEKPIEFDVAPVIANDRTLVPVRAIFEALGAMVEWDEDTRTVISAKGDNICILQIDNDMMFVNGESKQLDVAATIINDRTLIPLRAVSEAYNCTVDWDGDTRTVTIKTAE